MSDNKNRIKKVVARRTGPIIPCHMDIKNLSIETSGSGGTKEMKYGEQTLSNSLPTKSKGLFKHRLNEKQNKLLMQYYSAFEFDREKAKVDFPNMTITNLDEAMAKLVRKLLNRINKVNAEIVNSGFIGGLGAKFLIRLFRSISAKKYQLFEDKKNDLLQLIRRWTFLPLPFLQGNKTREEDRILRNLLINTMNLSVREKKIQKKLFGMDLLTAEPFYNIYNNSDRFGVRDDYSIQNYLLIKNYEIDHVSNLILNASSQGFSWSESKEAISDLNKTLKETYNEITCLHDEEAFSHFYKEFFKRTDKVQQCLKKIEQKGFNDVAFGIEDIFRGEKHNR